MKTVCVECGNVIETDGMEVIECDCGNIIDSYESIIQDQPLYNYIKPKNTKLKSMKSIDVLFDEGESGFVFGKIHFNDGSSVNAIRWNGSEDNPIGFPQTCGRPTWFYLPENFKNLINNYYKMEVSNENN